MISIGKAYRIAAFATLALVAITVPLLIARPTPISIDSCIVIRGQLWPRSLTVQYRLDGSDLKPIAAGTGLFVAPVGDEVWLGTDSGLFRVINDKPVPLLPNLDIYSITDGGSGVAWISSDRGIYKIQYEKNSTSESPVLVLPYWTSQVTQIGEGIFAATARGVFRVDTAKPEPITTTPNVIQIVSIGGEIYYRTETAVYHFSSEHPLQAPDVVMRGAISSIWIDREVLWIVDADNTVLYSDGHLHPVLDKPAAATQSVRGTTFLSTQSGLFEIADSKWLLMQAQPVGLEGSINSMETNNIDLFVGAVGGAYRIHENNAIRLSTLPTRSVVRWNSEILLGTNSGLYKVVENSVAPIAGDGSDGRLLLFLRFAPTAVLIGSMIIYFAPRLSALGALAIARRRLELEVASGKNRLTWEIEAVRRRSDNLFPAGTSFIVDQIHIEHRSIRATEISGDFYHFIQRPDGRLGIYMVDVEGHGLAASDTGRALFQLLVDRDWGRSGSAKSCLVDADRLVQASEIFKGQDIAVCMNFTVIDPELMVLEHSNAGMPAPLLFRSGEASPRQLHAAGVYVGAGYAKYGVKPDLANEQLGDGDILLVFSDGIPEARDKHGVLFGLDRIKAAFFRARHQELAAIADEILKSVKRWSDRETPDDDQTLVVARIGQVGTLERRADGCFFLRNAKDTAALCHANLRKCVYGQLIQHGYSRERTDQIWTALWEAIQNAIKYGSVLGDAIRIDLNAASDEHFIVEVRQPMSWESWENILGSKRRSDVRNGAFILGGSVIMLRLAEDISITDFGRQIGMKFTRQVTAAPKLSELG